MSSIHTTTQEIQKRLPLQGNDADILQPLAMNQLYTDLVQTVARQPALLQTMIEFADKQATNEKLLKFHCQESIQSLMKQYTPDKVAPSSEAYRQQPMDQRVKELSDVLNAVSTNLKGTRLQGLFNAFDNQGFIVKVDGKVKDIMGAALMHLDKANTPETPHGQRPTEVSAFPTVDRMVERFKGLDIARDNVEVSQLLHQALPLAQHAENTHTVQKTVDLDIAQNKPAVQSTSSGFEASM